MTLKLVPTTKPKKAGFKAVIEYEHGDADLTTHDTYYFQEGKNLHDVELWLTHFKHVRECIDNNRSYTTPFPEGLIEDDYSTVPGTDMIVPVETDRWYDNDYNYKASLDSVKITYIDEHGNTFNVEESE